MTCEYVHLSQVSNNRDSWLVDEFHTYAVLTITVPAINQSLIDTLKSITINLNPIGFPIKHLIECVAYLIIATSKSLAKICEWCT